MNAPSAWTTRPAPPASAPSGWGARARYTPEDVITLLWRERLMMLAVFLAVLAIGIAFAFTLKTTYSAHSSLLVRLGQEYVYEPRVGDAGRGAVPTTDQLIQSEVEILSSAGLRQRVVETLGVGRIAPNLASAFESAGPERRAVLTATAVSLMGKALKVDSAPDTSVIRLTYSASNPQTATDVLNAVIETYLSFRKSVLLQGASPAEVEQSAQFQDRLNGADQALQMFLTENNIGDFDAEKSSLATLHASLVDEQFRVKARLSEVEGRLGEEQREAGAVAPEIGLYRDNNAAPNDKLLQLKLDREDLLTRYKPSAQPVVDLDRRIAQLQALIAAGRADSPGARRTGPNPVYQTVETENLQSAAEAASLRQRAVALASQIQDVMNQQLRLTGLQPRYDELTRQRDLLQTDVKSLASKVEEDQAADAIAQNSNDNIRVVEPASAELSGKSLRMPVLALAAVFALFAALCAGLLRMFTRPGIATPSSAARTLDLPVLATAGLKS